jgi:hypothetical protein
MLKENNIIVITITKLMMFKKKIFGIKLFNTYLIIKYKENMLLFKGRCLNIKLFLFRDTCWSVEYNAKIYVMVGFNILGIMLKTLIYKD